MNKRFLKLTVMLVWLAAVAPCGPAEDAAAGDWKLVWSDEFNQPDGSLPDASKWSFETGGNGWGNGEMEYYTARTNNARIEDGKLVIEARPENFGGKTITSARLLTKGKCDWTYGRIEARIKIPFGQGIWPAFWMMGTNIDAVSWPACGEIDIMENIGREPGTVHGTVHGPGYSGSHGIGGPFTLPGGAALADDFHVYGIEWTTNRIDWYIDGRTYFSITPARLPVNGRWAFDQSKFVLLNLAVGGGWSGYPDATTSYPQRMLVDYVRVYQRLPSTVKTAAAAPTQAGLGN
jgi:beta-glucanase (GH16 family)